MKLPAKYIKNKNSISINEPYNSQKKHTPIYFQTKLVYKKSKNMVNQVHGHLRAFKKKQEAIQNITHYVSTLPSISANL